MGNRNNTWGGEEGCTLQRLCAKKELYARHAHCTFQTLLIWESLELGMIYFVCVKVCGAV